MTKRTRLQKFISYVLIVCMTVSLVNFTWLPSYADDSAMTDEEFLRDYVVSQALEPTNNALKDEKGNQVAEIFIADNTSKEIEVCLNNPDFLALNLLGMDFLNLLFQYKDIHTVEVEGRKCVLNRNPSASTTEKDQFRLMLITAQAVLGKDMTTDEFTQYLYSKVDTLTIGEMDGGKVNVMLYATNQETDRDYTVDYTMEFYNESHDVTIHYEDQDGQPMAADYKATLNRGETFEVTSPVIQDYFADQTVIRGTMGKAHQEYTVTYTINPDLVTGYYHYYLNGDFWQKQTVAEGRKVRILQPEEKAGHTFSGWIWKDSEGNEIPAPTTATPGTFYAYATQTANVHTLTYKVDGEVISTEQVAYGTALELNQAENKPGATFSGWATEDGTKIPSTMPDRDVTLVGSYKPIEYTVTFRNDNGNIITQTTDYKYGETLVVPSDPTKAPTKKYTYEFLGWSTDGTAATLIENLPQTVTKDVEYKAVYEENYINYTVIFNDHDGTELSKKTDYHYEDTVTPPADPADWSDDSYNYTFKGWDKTISPVYGNATYTAQYDKKAIGYTVSFYDWNGRLISEKVYKHGETLVKPSAPTRAADKANTYEFIGWNESVPETVTGDGSYTAVYKATPIDYTIIFRNEDGTELSNVTYHYGDTVSVPTAPSKAADETYTYTFAGWGKDVTKVEGDAVYQAVFTPEYIEYTIDFVIDGETISKTYHYGDTVEVPEATKAYDAINDYVFKGWDSEVSKVTGNKTYTAVFEAVAKEYTITFLNWDDSLISSLKYGWHGTAIEPQTPVKAGDNMYTYTFTGWDPAFDALVTGNAFYKAVFEAVYKEYTVQFVDDENNVISTGTYHYGDTVQAPEDPVKEATGAYSYTFEGWDKAITEVKGSTTYKAVFKQTQREYTVKFLGEDGETVISETVYHYGDAVQMPEEPASYEKDGRTYTFHGWTPVVSDVVTGDATYKAVFVDEANSATVRFYNHDGTRLLYEEAVNVGDDVSVEGKTATREQTDYNTYTFAGWVTEVNGSETPDFTNVQEDFDVYASFTKERRTYTVTFCDEDGAPLSEETYHYNGTIVEPETPTKAADLRYTYVFDGWDQEPGAVTGNLTFTATYKAVPIDYTVTFTVDGKETKKSYHYDDAVVFDGSIDKEDTAEYDYTFLGWKKNGGDALLTTLAGEKVTGDTAYEAVYQADRQQYTVTFYDESGQRILGSQTVAYGEAAAFPGETPVKAEDPVNTYAFAGWMTEAGGSETADLAEVKGDIKVYAAFTATAKTYKATVYDADGEVLTEDTYAYGEELKKVDNPTKATDNQYSYTFRHWLRSDGRTLTSLANEIVTADVSYTPVFDQTPVPYEITWVVEGVKTKESYVYNDMLRIPQAPSKDKTAKYTYTFAGWVKDGTDEVLTDLSGERVTADTTYTAKFEEKINTHKVSFYCEDTLVRTVTVNYGDAAVAPEPLQKESDEKYNYTFERWEQDFSEITADLRVDAVYSSSLREYTIRWMVDGKAIEKAYPYGTVPAFDGTPAKAETPKFKYVFTGWDTEPVAVTGPAVYTAQFEQQYNYVATINGVYYKTIESALAAAKAGDAVIVEHNCTITEDTVVPKGVTLFLPCQDDDKVFVPSIDTYNPEGTNVNGKPSLYKQVTIAEDVKVDIQGTVIVNAITGRPRSSGDHDITGGYSEIILNGQLNVQNGGLLDVYGYVRGDGQVTTESGGTIYDLYVVRKWRGGSQALSMYQENIYPMNEVDCHNISVPINVVYGATYSGTVRMYADDGSGPKYYCTRFPQVDVNNGLFRLTSKDGYVQKTFDGTYENYDIYGGAIFSESTLYIVAMNLSTSLFIYPIDGDIKFRLHDGDYSFEESYKFLPGSSVEVDGDSKLTIGEDTVVSFYEVFKDVQNTGNTQYPSNRAAAVLKMASGSELSILGKLGGRVSCGNVKITRGDDAGLNVTTKEANGYRNGSVKITNDFKATRSGFDGAWYNKTYYWTCSSATGHEMGGWTNTARTGYQKGICENCDHTEERYAPAAYLTDAIAELPDMVMTEEKLARVETLRSFYESQNAETQDGVDNIALLEEAEAEAADVAALREGYTHPSVDSLSKAFAAYEGMSADMQNHVKALYEDLTAARDAFVAGAVVEEVTVTSTGLESIQVSWGVCDDAVRYQVNLLDEKGGLVGSVEKAGTSHEFTGLKQTGIYEVRVRPVIEINGTPFTGTAKAASGQTAISEVQNLRISQITMNSATVSWQAPEAASDKQTGYQVILKDAKNDVVAQTTTTELSWSFTGLDAGTAYNISVYPLFDLDGEANQGLVQTVHAVTVPGQVRGLAMTDLSGDKASFSWTAPAGVSMDGFAAKGYQLTLKNQAGQIVKTVETAAAEYQFTGLSANQNYTAIVKPLYTYNGTACETAAVDFAFSTLPKAATGLTVTGYDSDSLTVSWNDASLTGGSRLEADGWQIAILSRTGALLDTVRTDTSGYRFSGLQEGETYQIRVCGVYHADQNLYMSESTSITATTLPGAVTGLGVVSCSADGLTFQWAPKSGAAVSAYKVTMKAADGTAVSTFETKLTTASFDNLSNGTVYTLSVTPVYAAGGKLWNGKETAVSAATLPGAVEQIKVDDFAQNEITLSWNAPEQHHSDAAFSHYAVQLQTDSGITLQAVRTTGTTYSFDGLQPGTRYQMIVTPVYLAGGREAAGVSTSAEAGTLTGTVQNLRVLDADKDRFRVTWEPPVCHDTIRVTAYKVVLKDQDGQQLQAVTTKDNGHYFDELTPGRSYTVSVTPVLALNSVTGEGGPAEVTAKTVQAAAGPAGKAPDKVTGLKVSARKAASVTLKWKASKSGADGYRVQRLSVKGKVQKTVYTAKLTYRFTKLKAGTVYQYRVTPYVKSADGKVYGKAVVLKTTTSPAKGKVKSLKAGKKQLKLTWKKTACTRYQVQIATNKKFTKGVKKYTVSSKYTAKTVKKLKAGTRYYVRVRSVKTYGGKSYYGVWSTYMQCKVK